MNRTKITLIIASSIDGRIALPNGDATNFGSSEDKKLLSESLSKVDATLFGAGTLKSHKSTFLVKDEDNNISSKQPVSIVAGDSNNFSNEWLYFKQPIKRWLIHSNISNKKNNDYSFEKEFFFEGSWEKTLKVINKEGFSNIGLLGGTKLINSFILENLIDEIKITIIPKIIGGNFSWIPPLLGKNICDSSNHWIIQSIKKLNTNEIFIHYTRGSKDGFSSFE